MATQGTAVQPLEAVGERWLRRAERLVDASADALDALNVFPLPDADTGANLRLTLQGVVQVLPLERAGLDGVRQAAIVSAHGNSGAIVAEMLASVCRGLQQEQAGDRPPGALLAALLQGAAVAARQAVARPVEGTVLSVADAAATAATASALEHPRDALTVARSAQAAAAAALRRTPDQLEVLARAGVVDAGGQAYVLLLDALVEVLGGEPAQPLPPPGAAAPAPVFGPDVRAYEVMYTVRGAADEALDELRGRLAALGDSVVVVGDHAVAQVHVHLGEPGAAVEAGLGLGAVSQIRITPVRTTAPPGRTVLCLVAGDGLGRLVSTLGAVAVPSAHGGSDEPLARALAGAGGDLVVLPNDGRSLPAVTRLVDGLRSGGRRVAVIPTVAQVQGLAAVAVHEPSADFDSVVVAMSTAAAHTRHGAVTVAERAAMTTAGRCRPGDVLGLVEGDFVEIGSSVPEVAWRVVQRLLATGGELLTLVTGAGADPGLAPLLRARTRRASDGVDVEVVDGGQHRYLLLVGLE